MKVKPAPGMTLIDPETYQTVPEDGIEVADTDLFWARRLADGDALKVEAEPSPEQHHGKRHVREGS